MNRRGKGARVLNMWFSLGKACSQTGVTEGLFLVEPVALLISCLLRSPVGPWSCPLPVVEPRAQGFVAAYLRSRLSVRTGGLLIGHADGPRREPFSRPQGPDQRGNPRVSRSAGKAHGLQRWEQTTKRDGRQTSRKRVPPVRTIVPDVQCPSCNR